jgi:plastocyanin
MLKKFVGAALTISLFGACDVAMDNPFPADPATDVASVGSADAPPADAGAAPVAPATGTTAPGPDAAAPSAGAPPAGAPVALTRMAATVEVVNNSFKPTTVDITVGGTITWKFTDSQDHNVRAAPAFDMGTSYKSGGATWPWVFKSAGSYSYVCGKHEFMKGTIKVCPALAASGKCP